ncbi:hypothetical protein [Arthrobacter sp. Leaf137]|uniref:hypothetical protein n=1 Tax=Arthrobacter sp. Leaf137 TaxID=1736271 RepID=UPI0012E1E1D8|nr:hypothetical protein [Arthrobacter sp. Leaf137]
MTSKDPLEFLRQTSQRHSEQQLELASDIVEALNAMHDAERVLYQARRRYIESFKKAKGAGWKAQELRDAGFPSPKVSVLKRRMDYRYLMMPPADPAEGADSESKAS